MYGDNESLNTYKVTFGRSEHARDFRNAVFGFWSAIKDDERINPNLKRSIQKLRHYLNRGESEQEFDFDGIMIGASDNPLVPTRRYGWALDIHDIAVAVTCLSIDTDDAQVLLQDLALGIRDVHADPSTTLTTDAGFNFGPYIQITEELEAGEITTDHIYLAMERIYQGQGITDFDRERYIHPSHEIDDPKTFVSSIVANVEVEGFGLTLRYIFEKSVELGEDETTASLQIVLHELIRMSSLNLDRPMVLLGASAIEEALLIKSGGDPDAVQSKLSNAINKAYNRGNISKELGYACSVVREVRNELGHTSWPSANVEPEEITLTSSLVILIITQLLNTPIFESHELEAILNEFKSHHSWDIQYENGNFIVEVPTDN